MDDQARKRERDAKKLGEITPQVVLDRLRRGEITEAMVDEAAKLGSKVASQITGHYYSQGMYSNHFAALAFLGFTQLRPVAEQCLYHALTVSGVPEVNAKKFLNSHNSHVLGLRRNHPFAAASERILDIEDGISDPVAAAHVSLMYSAAGVADNANHLIGEHNAEYDWQREYLIAVLLGDAP